MYGALVLAWMTVPTFTATMVSMMTDIVNGMCIPLGVYSSYVAEKLMSFALVSFSYILPMMLTVFCYARIVYRLKHKVTYCNNYQNNCSC